MTSEDGIEKEDERALTEIKSILELVDSFHDRDMLLSTRTIYLGTGTAGEDGDESGVDANLAGRLIKNLHVLESLSPDPVTLLMNNVGGDVYHGLAICDAIERSRCLVRAVVRGHAMSMGSVILQACDRRLMGPLSTQMIHYGTFGYAGHSKTALKWADEEERINRWMEGVYLFRIRQKNPRFTLARLRKMLNFDTILSAEDSVRLGLADEVG